MQFGEMVMGRSLRLAIFLLGCSATALCSEPVYKPSALSLSSIEAPCRLQTKWIGLWPRFAEAVALRCGEMEFIVTNQNNLIGHVNIDTPEKALEYVRFFTSPDTYKFFDLGGLVEILPSGSADATFNEINPVVFRKHFGKAKVELIDDHECKPGLELACGKEFQVKRVVVGVNQHISEIVEKVYQRGFYALSSKRLLFKDASKLGILHFGDL